MIFYILWFISAFKVIKMFHQTFHSKILNTRIFPNFVWFLGSILFIQSKWNTYAWGEKHKEKKTQIAQNSQFSPHGPEGYVWVLCSFWWCSTTEHNNCSLTHTTRIYWSQRNIQAKCVEKHLGNERRGAARPVARRYWGWANVNLVETARNLSKYLQRVFCHKFWGSQLNGKNRNLLWTSEVPGWEVPGLEVPGREVPGPEVSGPEVPGLEGNLDWRHQDWRLQDWKYQDWRYQNEEACRGSEEWMSSDPVVLPHPDGRMEENCRDRCGNPTLAWQKKEGTRKSGESKKWQLKSIWRRHWSCGNRSNWCYNVQ